MALEMLGNRQGSLVKRLMPMIGFDEFETNGVVSAMKYLQQGSGYFAIQSTKPASLGYGLHDSPVAVLSWLLEKFQLWSDPRCPAFVGKGEKANVESGINDENVLINTTLYYLTGSSHTSLLPYKESTKAFDGLTNDKKITNPAKHKPFGREWFAYSFPQFPSLTDLTSQPISSNQTTDSAFPYELAAGPKAWLPKLNVNNVFYRRHEYGGHFAGLWVCLQVESDWFLLVFWMDLRPLSRFEICLSQLTSFPLSFPSLPFWNLTDILTFHRQRRSSSFGKRSSRLLLRILRWERLISQVWHVALSLLLFNPNAFFPNQNRAKNLPQRLRGSSSWSVSSHSTWKFASHSWDYVRTSLPPSHGKSKDLNSYDSWLWKVKPSFRKGENSDGRDKVTTTDSLQSFWNFKVK